MPIFYNLEPVTVDAFQMNEGFHLVDWFDQICILPFSREP